MRGVKSTSDPDLIPVGSIKRGSRSHCQELDGGGGVAKDVGHLLGHRLLHLSFEVLEGGTIKNKYTGQREETMLKSHCKSDLLKVVYGIHNRHTVLYVAF